MKRSIIPLVFSIVFILSFLTGCQKDMPKPETKPKMMQKASSINAKTVMGNPDNGIPSLFVQYESRGHNVFVECIVTGVTFRESNQTNNKVGKMVIWVDGKKSREVSTAAFIIKELPSGNHHVKLDVVDLHNKPYGISKEFMVNIPKN